jgi:ribosome-associated heat shock protein Hsp15
MTAPAGPLGCGLKSRSKKRLAAAAPSVVTSCEISTISAGRTHVPSTATRNLDALPVQSVSMTWAMHSSAVMSNLRSAEIYNQQVDAVRLDVWLDVACLFRTRSEAQKACKSGRIDVNDQTAKPHREIHPGDTLSIKRPLGRRQRVVVKALADRHVAKAEARALYEDVTPPPTAEEVEARQMARMMRPFLQARPSGAPDKRQRRAIRKLKEQG